MTSPISRASLPLISVVVCTCGREALFKRTLLSLNKQSLSPDQYEILVVENGRRGAAEATVADFQKQFAPILYLHEPLQGLSRARNAGLKAAAGAYLAFLDDDAVADGFWLENILKTFVAFPEAGAVGGKILPVWEEGRPSWVAEELLKYLSILDYGDRTIFLGEKNLFGTNIAFNKVLLEQIGGFSLDLGRNGDDLLSGEEAFAQRELLRQGHTIVYNPDIKVGHHIPGDRLCKEWFERRAFCEGATNAVMDLKLKKNQIGRIVFLQALSFLRKPRQLLSLAFDLKNDAIFSERIEAIIKISHIRNLMRMGPRNLS